MSLIMSLVMSLLFGRKSTGDLRTLPWRKPFSRQYPWQETRDPLQLLAGDRVCDIIITRAKKVLVMVGTKKALAYAVRNVTVTKRNTLLKERLEIEK